MRLKVRLPLAIVFKSRSGLLFRASAHTGMEYIGCGDASVESAETPLLYTKCGPEEFLRKAVRRAANLIYRLPGAIVP